MPIYTHSENGLTLAVYRTALHCYAWILFLAGQPNQVIDYDETAGRHGADRAVREGQEALKDYRAGAVSCS